MSGLLKIRSGSVKVAGTGAFFAAPRSVSRGLASEEQLDIGCAPARSSADAEVRVGDVLVTLRGPVNTAIAVTRSFSLPLFATLELAVLRPSEHLDPGYLAWFVNLPASQTFLASGRMGGAVPRLPLPALRTLPLMVPPLEVQRRIAAVAHLSREENQLNQRLATLRAARLEAQLVDIVHQQSPGGAAICMQ